MPKIMIVRQMGCPVANTKIKRKKIGEKTGKGPKNVKNEIFEKRKKHFFSISLKNIF